MIRKHPIAGFAIVDCFASDTGFFEEEYIPDVREDAISYKSIREAELEASLSFYEYGGDIHPECFNEDYITVKEIYLKDDYDCESCGTTYNHLKITVNFNKKYFKLESYLGCYDYNSIDSGSSWDEIESFINNLCSEDERVNGLLREVEINLKKLGFK